MIYFSTNNKSHRVSFREAVVNGLAPDGGLYMPESIPVLPRGFLKPELSIQDIGLETAKMFFGDEISSSTAEDIIREALTFPVPLVQVEENIFSMELFHGPTLAFKDVGARFMARVLSHFMRNQRKEICILTATSGDTGSAVASGFYGTEGVRVVVLYPSGGVSILQEKQMTTLGKNITALEVAGTFDDCQALVKKSFSDPGLKEKLSLSSANSINIARLIPQSFYYLLAGARLKKQDGGILFSVPSGNFGNLTAGIFAKRTGNLKAKFHAATNSNDVFVKYISTGAYVPHPSRKTISNAMDVGSPSNFARLMDIYGNQAEAVRQDISASSVSDKETGETIRAVLKTHNYLCDPHGAVGYYALKKKLSSNSLSPTSAGLEPETGIFLATAHPAKFREVVEEAAGINLQLPPALEACLKKEKSAVKITADFNSLKGFLMG